MPTAPARPMPIKAVGMAAPASETLLDSEEPELEPELEPEPEPEPLVEEEPRLELVVEPDRLELRLELELEPVVPLPPMKVPLGAMEAVVPLGPSRVPVPRTPGAVVMGLLVVALERPALEASEEAAEVREERPARSVGTR